MRTRPFVAILLLLAPLAAACSAPSAEDLVQQVLATRNQFEVALSSWIDRDAGTPNAYLYLDVNVVKNTEQNLTRLTVMVEQLDANNEVLTSQRVAIDVSDMDMDSTITIADLDIPSGVTATHDLDSTVVTVSIMRTPVLDEEAAEAEAAALLAESEGEGDEGGEAEGGDAPADSSDE